MSYYLGRATPTARDAPLRRQFEAFIRARAYPCVGAKAALAQDGLTLLIGRDIRSAWDDLRLHEELRRFVERTGPRPALFTSFAMIFRQPVDLTEEAFERHLWARLQSLHDKDRWRGFRYDPAVAADPASPHFGFSVAGKGFFIVGLHPRASRRARRFHAPTIVFNLHDQFVQLREEGRYQKLRGSILGRDRAFSGSVNPMLAVHGQSSEARQYSGRRLDADWRCPFHAKIDAEAGADAD